MPTNPDPGLERPYPGAIVHVRDRYGACQVAVVLAVYVDAFGVGRRVTFRTFTPTPLGLPVGSEDVEGTAAAGPDPFMWHTPHRGCAHPLDEVELVAALVADEPSEPDFDLGPEVDDEGGMSEYAHPFGWTDR